MKLGIIASPTRESFVQAKEKGLEFVEFCINMEQDVAEFLNRVKDLKEWVKEYGVPVGSMGRWGTDKVMPDGSLDQGEIDKNYRLIDAAAELGCPHFCTGVNSVQQLSYYENIQAAISYLSPLAKYGAEKGVKVSVYNCHWNNYIDSDPAWTLVLGQIPELGIKFDSSHSIYGGRDYLSEMKKWGSRFAHVHIKGALRIDGERFDDPPAGMDETNWGAFMAVLYACGYKGNLSIEPHSENWRGDLGNRGIDFTIQFIKPFLL